MGEVEARPFEPLAVRFGVHSNPATWTPHWLERQGIELDLAYTNHAVLPGTLPTLAKF